MAENTIVHELSKVDFPEVEWYYKMPEVEWYYGMKYNEFAELTGANGFCILG